MKTYLCYITMLLISCSKPMEHTEKVIASKQISNDTIKPYANPSIIYGASFGCFFQTLYRNNKYELMLAFTSSSSINQFGNEKVLSFYKEKFKFDFVLGNLSNLTTDTDIVILTYSKACLYGTRRKVQLNCIVENDTTKILLRSLSDKPF